MPATSPRLKFRRTLKAPIVLIFGKLSLLGKLAYVDSIS